MKVLGSSGRDLLQTERKPIPRPRRRKPWIWLLFAVVVATPSFMVGAYITPRSSLAELEKALRNGVGTEPGTAAASFLHQIDPVLEAMREAAIDDPVVRAHADQIKKTLR